MIKDNISMYSILAGIAMGLGVILYYIALNQFELSIAKPLVSLNVLVTVSLSIVILKERITWMKVIGILLAIAALVLLST